MSPADGNESKFEEAHTRALDLAAQLRLPEPPFRFCIGWSDSYDDLLAGEYARSTGIEDLLSVAARVGRVLVHGEGGCGKTTILQRLLKSAIAEGNAASLVALGACYPDVADTWGRAPAANRVAMLLGMGGPEVTEELLAEIPTDRWCFVFIDGLNEVPRDVAQEVIAVADVLARRYPSAAVILADRLVRRTLPGEQWAMAAIQSLSRAEIERVLGNAPDDESAELLGCAFFLSLAEADPHETSRSRAFRSYLEGHAGVTHEELESLAGIALEAYRLTSSRMIDLSWFKAEAGENLAARLRDSGILVVGPTGAYFRHHLFHDYLASAYVAARKTTWNREHFDALSFSANSFDGLALALQQIPEPEDADTFVREVYDWNLYASGYVLAKGKSLGLIHVSAEMTHVVLAVLAERRWDLVLSTARGVTDALRLFPDAVSKPYLDAPSLSQVFEIVEGLDIRSPALRQWRKLFLLPEQSDVSDEIVLDIQNTDSVTGWSVSNVLKRVGLTSKQLALLARMLQSSKSSTIRWRITHTLGAHPSAGTVEILLGTLSDEDKWVRYGAIRSLVECAARWAKRGWVFQQLSNHIEAIAGDESILHELQRAVLLRAPPSDWPRVVAPVLESLWASAETIEEQDQWRRVAYDVERAGREQR